MSNLAFSVRNRDQEVAAALAAELDVLVVGLGATGAGVALDAASRGLSVAAVDMGDVASGTSSKSSKLIHGGLRYLEHYEFGLVHESVVERQILLRLAPHLVRPMEFLYPVWPDTAKRRLLGLGLTTYDVFAGMRGIRRHERIDAEEAVARAPALAGSELAYCYVYGDCATDDARLVLAVVQAARRFGALTLTYTRVEDLLRDEDGRVRGARVRDRLSGTSYDVRARHVVNATGVWVDQLLGMEQPGRPRTVLPSKGVHLVVPRESIPLDEASVLLPSRQGDGRSMFAIPWGGQTILGTTDTAYDGCLDALDVTAADVEYVLAATNTVFGRDLGAHDVASAWAGVRPLLRGEAASAGSVSDLSRRHALSRGPGGLVTVTGGKLTTYRRMARDVVDLLVEQDGRRARCRTEEIPLGCTQSVSSLLAELRTAAAALGVSTETAGLLVRQYGDAAPDVLGLVATTPALAAPLSPDAAHIAAEVVYAARHEGAITLDDVFSRRTRLSLRARDAALPTARAAAGWLADETGRDEAWAHAQVTSYADAVRRERGVLGLPAYQALSA